MFASALPDPDRHAAFYAGVPAKRAMAWLVDTALAFLLTAIVVVLTFFVGLFVLIPLYLAISFALRTASLAAWSATPGMALLGIELRAADGRRLSPLLAALHTGAFLLCAAFILPQLASMFLMLTAPRGQGLPDILLGTAAINRPAQN